MAKRKDSIQIDINVAAAYKRKGKYGEALKIYSDLNAVYPNDPLMYRSWGKALLASGNYDLATDYFAKAIFLAQFFGNDDPDCRDFIRTLKTEPRNSVRFIEFIKRISGNQNYKIDPSKVVDHMLLNSKDKAQAQARWMERQFQSYDDLIEEAEDGN